MKRNEEEKQKGLLHCPTFCLRDSCHWLDGLHRCPNPAQAFFFFFFSSYLKRDFSQQVAWREQWQQSWWQKRENRMRGGFRSKGEMNSLWKHLRVLCEIICLHLPTIPLYRAEVGVTLRSRCLECCSTALLLLLLLQVIRLETLCRFHPIHSPGSHAQAAVPRRVQPGEPCKTRGLSWHWRSAQNQPK